MLYSFRRTAQHRLLYTFIAFFVLAACSSDDPAPADEADDPDNDVPVTGIYTIANLAADTLATSSGNATPLYYSLEQNKAVPASQVQTANWDIAFLSIYNSSIAANNGSATSSPGYGGPGKGGLYLLQYEDIDEQYYDEGGKPLKALPARSLFEDAFNRTTSVAVADEDFLTGKRIDLDYFGGTKSGWAYYDFYGQMYPDRPSDEKAHICYALPRPILVRTARGNYAKVILYSMYKGAPEDPDRSHKAGFLTFKYAIQKDGSKNLDISETN
ncbi:HmuY family protein [Dawidia soli]|uniref:HmuY family protein n=1 Tax=Dawidia soli TaxID=2782352 RepID=A0AAP2DDA3_9BACT|nr:HmuY family protein [Dawidia soli]MBT1689051.1 HmuY family protein [Dawidia soli]